LRWSKKRLGGEDAVLVARRERRDFKAIRRSKSGHVPSAEQRIKR
jgi:hypothetical protein